MVKKIKYFLILLLFITVALYGSFLLFSDVKFPKPVSDLFDKINEKEQPEDKNELMITNNQEFLSLKEKIYSGMPFEEELSFNSAIFIKEHYTILQNFAKTGIKTVLQIKKDFLVLNKLLAREENIVNDKILKSIFEIRNMSSIEKIKEIMNQLFLDEYNIAVTVAETLKFENDISEEAFHKWKKDLKNYVLVDNIIKHYL